MSTDLSPARLAHIVAAVCRAEPVLLAYLFGSYARGTADSESDIDIAVVARPGLSKEERFDLRFRLRHLLTRDPAFSPHELDVIVLQDVPPLLRYNVIRTGQVLYTRDATARGAFEMETERLYDEESPYLEREADLTIQRILSHPV